VNALQRIKESRRPNALEFVEQTPRTYTKTDGECVQCFNCQQIGHYASQCSDKKKNN